MTSDCIGIGVQLRQLMWCPVDRRMTYLITPTLIAWSCGNDSDGARLRVIVMFFLCLHMLAKFHLAMSVEIQFAVEYDFRWTLRLGDVTLQGEHVALDHSCVYRFYYYDRRQVIKQDYALIAAKSVFDGTVILLDLWDVFRLMM